MPNTKSISDVELAVSEYLGTFRGFLEPSFVNSMNEIVFVIARARDRDATVYIAGNGGSASTASHWVNDLGKATKCEGRTPIRAMSLNDNVSWMTALANDEGYHRVFAGQLENFAKPGDVLIVISASGNSPNLIEAVNLARSRNTTTIALLGFDGGMLKELVDKYLWLRTEKGAYGIVEGAHGVLCHILTTCVARAAPSNGEK